MSDTLRGPISAETKPFPLEQKLLLEKFSKQLCTMGYSIPNLASSCKTNLHLDLRDFVPEFCKPTGLRAFVTEKHSGNWPTLNTKAKLREFKDSKSFPYSRVFVQDISTVLTIPSTIVLS